MEKQRKVKPAFETDAEENLYSEFGREELVENDELTPLEEAFMSGWDKANEVSEEVE